MSWISVKDMLPEFELHEGQTSNKVNIFFDGYVSMGYIYKEYNGKSNVWFTCDDTHDNYDQKSVTHWQPLPSKPIND